jgi:isoleucyl-tRNA synthetase
MSKSFGNVIEPQQIVDVYGAEILRLWVASEDYTDDIRISQEILKRLVEAYRRIRNTARFILGNLYDFNPESRSVLLEEMEEIDRFALHRLQEVIERVRDAYDRYQFHVVYHTIHNFCAVDLSAFYLDILKDRLYTSAADSRARRSAQTAMLEILDNITRLMAPIMSFTMEEIWQALPASPSRPTIVHLACLPDVDSRKRDETLAQRWRLLLKVRSEVSKPIEAARKEKIIGHSLDARVLLLLPEETAKALGECGEILRQVLILSALELVPEEKINGDYWGSQELPGLFVKVEKAWGEKCQRCWVYSPEVAQVPSSYPGICPRCHEVISRP